LPTDLRERVSVYQVGNDGNSGACDSYLDPEINPGHRPRPIGGNKMPVALGSLANCGVDLLQALVERRVTRFRTDR